MTVGINTPAYVRYQGTDTVSLYPIPFPVFTPADVIANVYRDSDGLAFPDLELSTDFTLNKVNIPNAQPEFQLIAVSGKEYLDGANLATGYTIFIKFNDEAFSSAKFRSFGNYAPEKLDYTFDQFAMFIKAVRYLASRALLMAEGGSGGFTFPSLIGHANQILQVNSTEDGFDFGPDVQDIFDARNDAQAAAAAAGASQIAAANSAATAVAQAVSAADSAASAYAYSQQALAAVSAAENSAENALASELSAEFWASFYAFEKVQILTFADSPYTVTYADDRGKIFAVDTTDGPVTINLPSLSGMPDSTWKVGACKTTNDANTVTIRPIVGQTINQLNSNVIQLPNFGVVLDDDTPTNWKGSIVIVGSFGSADASSGLPAGGDDGDYLEKQSSVEGDAAWESGTFSGFSTQFNRAWDTKGVRATLLEILQLNYAGPLVSLSGTGSSSTYEKGSNFTATTLSANVTKRSDPIARIEFLLGTSSLVIYEPPANTGSGVTSYPWSGVIQDTSTFNVRVTDTGASGGPTTATSSVSFNFVYPYYWGSGAPGLSATGVAGLGKLVAPSNANLTRSFTTVSNQVYYFAYPASYGDLTSILDINGFETYNPVGGGSWIKRIENITGLDGSPVSYRIFEFRLPQAAGTMDFTFKR